MRSKKVNKASPGIQALLLLGAVATTLLPISCKEAKQADSNEQSTKDLVKKADFYQEPFRPQFHFSPREKWMNDPNGLVYSEGVYHLFYQHYPEDIVWGPMHWGHATSTDLFHSEHHSIALYPDEQGYIFSGSAVLDKGNTSGLGTEGKDQLVAIFFPNRAFTEMHLSAPGDAVLEDLNINKVSNTWNNE